MGEFVNQHHRTFYLFWVSRVLFESFIDKLQMAEHTKSTNEK